MNADEIIKRLRQIYDAKSDSSLAAALNLAPSAPSNWRQRNRPPLALCAVIARERGLSLDWLIFGDGAPAVRDVSDADYLVVSQVGARMTRFIAMWSASRTPEEMVWLEQHLRRTVPEYREWADMQVECDPPPSY